MAQVDLCDPRYLTLNRAFATLIAKRNSIDRYKSRLCTRGDLVPLTDVAFISSPTAHRVCVRFLTDRATMFRWQLGTLDIIQSFLPSPNLNDRDRLGIIPPPMIAHPWKSDMPPDHIDLKQLPRPRIGFLLVRPLYEGRGAPMRWFVTFSTILRMAGYRQLQTDVCVFTRIRPDGKLGGSLVAHVDILFNGSHCSCAKQKESS